MESDRALSLYKGGWTEAEARRVLALCARSGVSIAAFARRAGLSPKRFYWWMHRLGFATLDDAVAKKPSAHREVTAAVPAFVPVVVKGMSTSAATPTPTPIVIRHGGAMTMEIAAPAAVPPAWIAAVMIELERGTCS